MLYYYVLYCIVLYWIVLYCIVLYCIVAYHIISYHITLHYITWHCIHAYMYVTIRKYIYTYCIYLHMHILHAYIHLFIHIYILISIHNTYTLHIDTHTPSIYRDHHHLGGTTKRWAKICPSEAQPLDPPPAARHASPKISPRSDGVWECHTEFLAEHSGTIE